MHTKAYLFILVLLLGFLSSSFKSQAQMLSHQALSQLQFKYLQSDFEAALADPAAYLTAQDLSVTERIYLKSKLLSKLALEEKPSVIQQHWVEEQLNSTQVLLTPDSHHPEQSLVITNIKNAAKMVDAHWQAYAKKRLFEQRWDTGSWSWDEYFSESNRASDMAISLWLDELSEQDTQLLAKSYLSEGLEIDGKDNRLISLLYQKIGKPELLDALWNRDVDVYSHKILRDISGKSENIAHLIRATAQPKLSSQALFSLMKEHSDNPQAQVFIQESLQDNELSDISIATLSVLGDEQFQTKTVE